MFVLLWCYLIRKVLVKVDKMDKLKGSLIGLFNLAVMIITFGEALFLDLYVFTVLN